MAFVCRQCNKPGYQPFAKAQNLKFLIRSNTKSNDPYASSTPPGKLPELKLFMMNVSRGLGRLCTVHCACKCSSTACKRYACLVARRYCSCAARTATVQSWVIHWFCARLMNPRWVCESCTVEPMDDPTFHVAVHHSPSFGLRSIANIVCHHAFDGQLLSGISFLQDEANTYCGTEVMLNQQYAKQFGGQWYSVSIPLSAFRCNAGSVGGLAAVDRVDIQNLNIRDADICLDNIELA